jgi:hypothetical protein
MKIFASLCATVVLSAASAAAAEPAVSPATLSAMGLSSMESLSDADGLAVRGKGTFANVWGGSTATWGGQTSSNNYSAGSSWLGKSSGAVGSSTSFAGKFNFSGYGGFFGR